MHLTLVVEEKSGKLSNSSKHLQAAFEQIWPGVKVRALDLLVGRCANICSSLARAGCIL